MKYLSLKIGGTPIPTIASIQHITDFVSPFGINIFSFIIEVLLFIAIIIAIVMLIYAGIQWIMSEGDDKKMKSAKDRITYSIIGLVIAFLAFFIVSTLGNVFGISLTGQ